VTGARRRLYTGARRVSLNRPAQVPASNLTEYFVNLPRLRLAAEPFTELALNHAERRLDVATLVVTLHKPLLIREFYLGGPIFFKRREGHS
jgi:hypothetical protein